MLGIGRIDHRQALHARGVEAQHRVPQRVQLVHRHERLDKPTHDDNGYWLSSWNGNVANYGDAPNLGSMYGTNLAAPIVGITATRDGGGFWLQGSDGGIFTFGDAPFLGSMGGQHLNAPMVGITSI
mgnify:CR=1 FL=1